MKLVADWRKAWKWFSMQAFALIVAIPAVWVTLPDDVKAMMPSGWGPWVLTTIALCGMIGRMVDQNK